MIVISVKKKVYIHYSDGEYCLYETPPRYGTAPSATIWTWQWWVYLAYRRVGATVHRWITRLDNDWWRAHPDTEAS